MKTNIDLFEHYDELPLKIKEIINVFNTEIDLTENAYDLCKKLVSELEIHGYTCEFGLDAEPYNLQKLETTNETPEEMNTTEKNILIAEFLQVDKNENGTFELPQYSKITLGGTFKTEFQASQLKYNSDWNWLIEVIKKISNTDYVTDFFINALTGYTTIETYSETEEGKNKVFSGFGEGIKGTYDAVVEFIKWHNEQKN